MKMPPRRDSDVFNHSPYSELSGPVIRAGTVSSRKEALLNAYKRDQEPQPTSITTPLFSKSRNPAKPTPHSSMFPTPRDEESKGSERSVAGLARRKTGGFATHACRSPSCSGSSHQTRDLSKAMLYTIASLGLMGKGDVAGRIDDEQCTGSQSLLHTNTSGTLLPPSKKQCMLVSRIADQLTEKHPELKRVPTRELSVSGELLVVPPQDIGEDLSRLIDKALGERDNHSAEWSNEIPRNDHEGIFHNRQAQGGYLGDQTRFTKSPTVLSPEIRKTDPLKLDGIPQSANTHPASWDHANSSSTNLCDQGIPAADTFLPRSSDTETYINEGSAINYLETPKACRQVSARSRHQNITHHRSKHVIGLANARTMSTPCTSAEQMSPSEQGRCSFHLHNSQEKAASIEHDLQKYNKREQKSGPDSLPQIAYANAHRLDGSIPSIRQSTTSEPSSETQKSWRWWRFVLIDKKPSSSQASRTDTGTVDKQVVEDGVHVLADSGCGDEYESEEELEQEILRVLIHREQASEGCSPLSIVGIPEPRTPIADRCSKGDEDCRVADPGTKHDAMITSTCAAPWDEGLTNKKGRKSVSNCWDTCTGLPKKPSTSDQLKKCKHGSEAGKVEYKVSMTIGAGSGKKLKVDIRSTETETT
ncbi:MAG: hypothetical protein Q9187_000217 [Circinaria calcarea]